MGSNRLDVLRGLLDQDPTDSRTRYMLAMELAGLGRLEDAVHEFRRILAGDAAYLSAYFHGGQALEKLGRGAEAREMYRSGIEACIRAGDAHARSEMESALEALAE
jgi:Flp pilus assembly protein TadD